MEVYQFIRLKDRNALELCFIIICLASIPLTIMALVIVFTKSPPQMKTYKWIIINFTLTTFFTDVIICFLFDPIPLFPAVACYSKTWLANVDENANYILLCVSLLMLQLTLSGTLVAFLYRMRSLLIISASNSQSNFIYIIGAVYLITLAPIIFILIAFHKSHPEMLSIIHNTPQLQFLKNYTSFLATSADDPEFIAFGIVWLFFAFATVAACILVAVVIAVILHRRKLRMSHRSLVLHRSLMIHLTIQRRILLIGKMLNKERQQRTNCILALRHIVIFTAVMILMPVTTTLIPMLVLLSTRYIDVPFGAEFWNMIIAQAISMHSPLNTITVLLSTRHYRNAVLQIMRKFSRYFGRSNGKSVIATSSARLVTVLK